MPEPAETNPIRRLTPADAALFRVVRLEALGRNPTAFGSTLERGGRVTTK